jgi:mono/diheme cytochrome c family protein
MKATIIILILALIVLACHRKTAPSSGIIISNKANTETTKAQNDNPDWVSAGETIYTTRCGRCHGLKRTEKYTQQQWENILKTMIPKARLNDEQAKQVTAYVMANAKK